MMTGAELIHRLQAAGFVEQRTGSGNHRPLVNPKTKRLITLSIHTEKQVGTGLARRILREAGL